MKKVIIVLSMICSLTTFAQQKKVAVLDPVCRDQSVNAFYQQVVRGALESAVSSTEEFIAYDRTAVDKIMEEQQFQRSGVVSKEGIKKIGEMTGASYILIAEASVFDEQEIIVMARLIDIESGKIVNSSFSIVSKTDAESMKDACIKVVRALLNIEGSSTSASSS